MCRSRARRRLKAKTAPWPKEPDPEVGRVRPRGLGVGEPSGVQRFLLTQESALEQGKDKASGRVHPEALDPVVGSPPHPAEDFQVLRDETKRHSVKEGAPGRANGCNRLVPRRSFWIFR